MTPIPPFAKPNPIIGLYLSDISSDNDIDLHAELNL
jgi:hypothetical protein